MVSSLVPPADEARQRLIAKVASLAVVRRRAIRGTSPYLLYYSYALMEKVGVLESARSEFTKGMRY